MIKEEQEENEIPIEVIISEIPPDVDLHDIECKQGGCFVNSYRVAKKYQDIIIVEGIIIVVDDTNAAKPMPHVWNKLDNTHFDVTKEKVWTGRVELNETKEIKYFPVKFHSHVDFNNGDVFEFCSDTNENVEAIKNILDRNE
jgi:hypothetical protein